MAILIRAERVSRSFVHAHREITVLDGVSLEIEQGSFVVIVGPSGCGKSTLLNIIAGLLPVTAGNVYYKGNLMANPRLEMGYLTQKDTLMPWRTVEQNIEMPLEIRGIAKKERRLRANDLMVRVGLGGSGKLYPRELSGGMLRRAGLARMLVSDPETLLLDEPFAALDAQLRLDLQGELLRLWSGTGKSVLFVTHDIEEAIALGDRVVVLGSQGRIILDESIDLPRPRDVVRIRFQPQFVEIHYRLWNALMTARGQQEVKA